MIVQATKRPATTLRLLCEAASELGIEPGACLAGTGLVETDLETTAARFSTGQEVQAIENVARLLPGNVGLGAVVGSRMHRNVFGIWGFAVQTSPTVRAAIETSIEYVKLSFVIADMALRETPDRARLEFDMTGLPAATHRFILERHAVVGINFLQDLFNDPTFPGFEIETMDPDPSYASALSNQIGVNVAGGMTGYALTFPAAMLDLAMPKSDPATLQFCMDQCKALLAQMDGVLPPWSEKVRNAVVDSIGTEQKIEDIADTLAVTERTLRRRLTEEGTSFRELYTDARMAIARELLEVTGLNVETVAWRVGYAETASFARAFARIYGNTPGETKKQAARRRDGI